MMRRDTRRRTGGNLRRGHERKFLGSMAAVAAVALMPAVPMLAAAERFEQLQAASTAGTTVGPTRQVETTTCACGARYLVSHAHQCESEPGNRPERIEVPRGGLRSFLRQRPMMPIVM